MGDEKQLLTVGEFKRWAEQNDRNMSSHFSGVHSRLGRIETKQDDHGERIAVLEHDAAEAKATAKSAAVVATKALRNRRVTTAGWGTGIAGAAIVVWEFVTAIKHYVK